MFQPALLAQAPSCCYTKCPVSIWNTSRQQVHDTLSQDGLSLPAVNRVVASAAAGSDDLAGTSVLCSGCKWQESGTTSKTKSKSVSILHGCRGLKDFPFNIWPCEDLHSASVTVPIPPRQRCWDKSMPPLLFDLVSPERIRFPLNARQWCGKQEPGRAPAVMLI